MLKRTKYYILCSNLQLQIFNEYVLEAKAKKENDENKVNQRKKLKRKVNTV